MTRFALQRLVTSCPVEILLNNAEQNLQSGQLHHWATSVIHSSLGILNPFRQIMQPFQEIMQPFQGIIQPFQGTCIPFKGLCIIQYIASIRRKQFHRDYIITPLAENLLSQQSKKPKKLMNHDHGKQVHRTYAW